MTELHLTKEQIDAYSKENAYAQIMFGHGGDDYIACRCLILNALWAGFPLASQAFEKMLKAFIFLETKKKSTLSRNDLHNPFLLKEELQSHKDYGLNKYDDVLKKLYGHFQYRYFDNKDQSRSMSVSEIDLFDELWLYMFERCPMPLEVKYRNGCIPTLFDSRTLAVSTHNQFWMFAHNKAMRPKQQIMQNTYNDVNEYFSNFFKTTDTIIPDPEN